MVQVTFDTTNDTLEELQDALRILEGAIERRMGVPATAHHNAPPVQSPAVAVAKVAPSLDMPDTGAADLEEDETAVDTGFFKITLKHNDGHEEQHGAINAASTTNVTPKAPTLNQLLSESITEEELTKMFKVGGDASAKPKTVPQPPSAEPQIETEKSYLEIVEYTDEK